jgi:UDP-glucose 4-epimerase
MTNKNIIVTGGAGYIGSHTCKMLHEFGYSPIVLDNLSTGHKSFIKWGEFENCDLREFEQTKAVIKKYKPLAVIHFAAFSCVGESFANPYKYYQNNILGTANLLQAMTEEGVNKIIFSSTCAVYGTPNAIPINEECATNPINAYGKTKLTCENLLKDFELAHNLKYVSLRYFNASGADEEAKIGEKHDPETHLIPLVIEAAIGKRDHIKIFGNDYETKDGTCIRDYIHVNDLALAHIKALEYILKNDKSEILNIGTGSGFSVKEVIESVKKITKKDIKVIITNRRDGDPAILIASNNKIKRILEWEAKYSDLDFIIKTALKWHYL